MKPNTTKAMTLLIAEIRATIPFDIPLERLCNGPCVGCAKKLLEYLDMEIDGYERALEKKDTPKLGDIDKLAKTATTIYRTLEKNKIVTFNPPRLI